MPPKPKFNMISLQGGTIIKSKLNKEPAAVIARAVFMLHLSNIGNASIVGDFLPKTDIRKKLPPSIIITFATKDVISAMFISIFF